jgi:transcriptional repressor NrdR
VARRTPSELRLVRWQRVRAGELRQEEASEVESKLIGNLIAKRLKKIDKVAYIRFASVFRRFVDVEEFQKEVTKLI